MQESLGAPRRARVGDALPLLTLPALDGSEMSLGQFAGKKLLLFVWASW